MKAKLLFTAALMAAMAVSQNETWAYTPMPSQLGVYATAEPLAEGEEVGEESDYTSCLRNAHCSDNTPGWVRNSVNKTRGYVVNNPNDLGPECQGIGIEFWVHHDPSNWEYGDVANKDLLWQMATSRIPVGQYVISAYAAGRYQDTTNQLTGELLFFAGDATVAVPSNKFQAVQVTTTVGLEPLKVGLRAGADNKNNWVAISQVQVKLQNTLASLQAAIGVAESIAEGDEALTAAIATARQVTEGTPAEFNAAILALNEAIDECLNRQLANVTESAPKDWSAYVDNIDFVGYRADAFDVEGSHPGDSYGGGTEIYQANSTMARTLTNLPNGKYRVSLQARTNRQNGELVVFARGTEEVTAIVTQATNDNDPEGGEGSVFQKQVNAMNAHIDDPSTWTSVEVLVTNGTLTFGSRQQSSAWCVYNGFKVEYLGVDLSALQASFTALQAEASQILDGGTQIPGGCMAALTEYANKDTEGFTANDYDEAITALTELLADIPELVALYADYMAIETFKDVTVAGEEAKSALSAALTAVDEAAPEAIDAAVADLLPAARAYAAQVTGLIDGVDRVNVGFLATNLDFSADYNKQYPAGWQTEPVLALDGDNFRGWEDPSVNGEYSGRMCERYVHPWVAPTIGSERLIYQVLEGMPEGSYVMKAASYNRFVNDGSHPEPAGKAAKLYVNDIDKEVNTTVLTYDSVAGVVGEDKVLEFGLKAIAAPDVNWYGLADVDLYYCGQNTAALAQTLAENRVIAGKKATEGLPEGAIGILTDTDTPADMAGYETALVELSEAIDATYLADRYAGLNELVAEMDAFNRQTVASEEAETTFGGLIADAQSKLAGALTLADIDAINELSAARLNYWAGVYDLAEGVERVDVTFMGDNMDMGNTDNRGAWYTTKTGEGNCGPMGANPDILGLNARFIESYVNIDNSQSTAYDSNTALIVQDLEGMAKGAYTFAAYTFNRREHFSDKNVTPNPIRLFVNGFAKEVSSSQFGAHSINGMVGEDGKLSFGFKASSNLNTDWHGIADAHLYYLGAGEDVTCDVVLDENSPYVALEDAKANVTLYRALKSESWNTFCVPFDMEVSALGEVKELTSAKVTEKGDATLMFGNVASVEAGKAYIVKAKAEAVNPMTFESVAVKGGDVPEAEAVDGVKLQGNYVSGYVPLNAYFISDNMFYLADVENSAVLKGFRAYVTVEGNASMAGVNRMLIDFGDATGIENVQAGEADKLVDVVSLGGMTVKAGVKKAEALDGLQKGVYIVDGKKYVVK